jgi:GT2 family glycosyltransferase
MYHITASLLNINEAALTIDVLDKLAGLSDQDWKIQLILVDNGSRTDQLQLLQDWFSSNRSRFEEFLFVAASRNLGATGGRNLAFKLASSDRILILDNDVILPDDAAWINRLWQGMEEDPRVGVIGPMLVFADYPEIVQGTGIGLSAQGRVGYLNRGNPVTNVPPVIMEVVASPSACWLVRREAQQAVGFLSDEFYPVQYEDVDLCIRLSLSKWKILCDCGVRIKHIENVTTRNLKDHSFDRLTVRRGMRLKEKWADVLPKIANIAEDEIYWGSIPRCDT